MKRHSRLKIFLLILLNLILIVALAVGFYFMTTDLTLTFTQQDPVFLLGEEKDPMDFVKECNGEVTVKPKNFDTSTFGDREVVYTVKKDIREKEFRFWYSVTEDVKPKVLRTGDGVVLERGTEFDIDQVISYGDNLDPMPSLKLKGKVNMNKNGSYPLHAKVTDECGNRVEWDFTVEVADAVPEWADDRARKPFEDFVAMHAKKGRHFGIDVSVWQGDIDFKAVKKAGCEFVIIRIGYSEGGKVTEDSKFAQNLKRARAAGLKVGIYLYTEDASEKEILSSADWVVNRLDGAELDLPIGYDWENFEHFQTYGIDFGTMNRLYDVFAERVGESGYDCMLYGSKIMLEDLWEDRDTRPIWLAHFADDTNYHGPKLLWQASDTGRISGIDGDVDMDILYDK